MATKLKKNINFENQISYDLTGIFESESEKNLELRFCKTVL